MPARLDQHFLADAAVSERIVAAAAIEPGEDVVEIGPGRGVLTKRLLAAGARLTAVEFDCKLARSLASEYEGMDVRVVHSDWLKFDLESLPKKVKIVSNLPYSVATPILQRLLDWPAWTTAILMFQKEVVDRILAEPGSKAYGILSLSVKIKAEASLLCVVGPRSFLPPPKVHSAVARFTRLARPRLPEDLSEKAFFRTVKAAFSQKRKMAAKLLSAAYAKPRAEVEGAFEVLGLRKDARAETIGLDAFIELAKRLAA